MLSNCAMSRDAICAEMFLGRLRRSFAGQNSNRVGRTHLITLTNISFDSSPLLALKNSKGRRADNHHSN